LDLDPHRGDIGSHLEQLVGDQVEEPTGECLGEGAGDDVNRDPDALTGLTEIAGTRLTRKQQLTWGNGRERPIRACYYAAL
jgi:hypothetical protein